MNLDFADIKPGLVNWALVGMMSLTFLTFFKFIFAKWQVPYLTDLFGSI